VALFYLHRRHGWLTPASVYSWYAQYVLLAHIRTFVKKKTRGSHECDHGFSFFLIVYDYIMPIPAPAPAGIAGVSSLIVATADSVVRSVEATDVAFCNALLVTFTGSRIP
jgi:hypothetical protein